jgi:uncharacterized membrane protein
MADKQVTGPIQVFVVGFDKLEASGRILAELQKVRKRGVIRVIDVLFVQKAQNGAVSSSMHLTDLSEAERMRLGAIAGGLIGLRAGGQAGAEEGAVLGAMAVAERDAGLSADRLADLAQSIPNGSAAAILVIEHHWATRLRAALADAGGHALMQAMITPDALILVGDELRARAEAEAAIELAEAVKYAAAVEIVQTLAAARLIEKAALEEAADVVATALAIEDAAAQDVADTLLAADLIKEDAAADAFRVVSDALETEEAAAQPV